MTYESYSTDMFLKFSFITYVFGYCGSLGLAIIWQGLRRNTHQTDNDRKYWIVNGERVYLNEADRSGVRSVRQ